VADNEAAQLSEDDLFGLEGDKTGEGLLVDHLVAALLNGEELGMLRGR